MELEETLKNKMMIYLNSHVEEYIDLLEKKNKNKQLKIEKLVERLHNQSNEISMLLQQKEELKKKVEEYKAELRFKSFLCIPVDDICIKGEEIDVNKKEKTVLNELSKEQLIYLIERLIYSQKLIGEVCVEESKLHIESDEAVDKIRECIYRMPSLLNATDLKAFIDMKMNKISAEEYRKTIGLE